MVCQAAPGKLPARFETPKVFWSNHPRRCQAVIAVDGPASTTMSSVTGTAFTAADSAIRGAGSVKADATEQEPVIESAAIRKPGSLIGLFVVRQVAAAVKH